MVTALARRFKVDVSSDNATWIPFKGIDDFNNQETPALQSADDYDTNGFTSWEKTMTGAKVTVKALRKTNAGVFDSGQELVRAARFQFGTAARVYIRWYDRNGAPEAYSMYALVDWNPSKTAVVDLDEITVTFTSDGIVAAITNPFTPTTAPVITSVTPSGVTATNEFEIKGSGFTGTIATTGVKVGGVNATSWIVDNDQLIIAIMPTGTAGATTVVVTNAVGASNSFAYTRA